MKGNETKICNKCTIEQELSEFGKDNATKDKLKYTCKKCCSEFSKKYYKDNSVDIKNKQSTYRINNPEKVRESNLNWVLNNPESVKKSYENYRKNNLEIVKKSQQKYRNKIRHIISWRSVLWNSLRRLGKVKEGHTIDLIGYSPLEFKNHIESLFTDGMTWDNYGEWHIDHIQPVSSFDPNTLPSVVNALTNLRPLWATTREINGVVYEGNMNRKYEK